MSFKTQQSRKFGGILSILLLNQMTAGLAPAAMAHGLPTHASFGNAAQSGGATPYSGTASTWHSSQAAGNFLPAAFGMGVTSLPAAAQTLPLASQTMPLQTMSLPPAQNHAAQFASHLDTTALRQPAQNISLDLSSANNSIVLSAATIRNGAVTIDVGGASATYHVGDSVTAAELVAISQAQLRGGQTIQLDDQGRATGGTFSLSRTTSAAGFNITNVVVPTNVTAVDRAGIGSNVNLSGDLVNNGSIIQVASKHGLGGANIAALDIVNGATGLITTNAGSGVADLNLTAAQNFSNAGTIAASGNLNISAGGNLTNTNILTAQGNVGLQSTNIVNSGTVSATTGNVNLGAPGDQSQTMNINNTGGTISALNGAINVRDAAYAGTGNTNLVGGDLLSKQLNLNSGGGTINVDVKDLTGEVVSSGEAVHVMASTDTLILGKQCLVGDPTYYNDAGDISLNGDIVVGEDLVIIARGDVVATTTINNITANDGVNGRNITIVAGVNVTGSANDPTSGVAGSPPPGNTTGSVSFTGVYNDGTNDIGGNIDLSKAGTGLTIDAGSLTGKSGNITLAAYAGGDNGIGGLMNGVVSMSLFTKMNATGSSIANDGNVTILAGGTSGSFIGKSTAGNFVYAGTQPTLADTSQPIIFDKNGTVTNGNAIVRDYAAAGTSKNFVQLAGSIVASKDIYISGLWIALAGGSLSTNSGNITIASTGATAQAKVQIQGDIKTFAGGNINIISSGIIDANFAPAIMTNASATNPGNITMIGGAAFTETATQLTITGKSGLPGDVNLTKTSGAGDIAQLSANATSGGKFGGNITLVSYNGLVDTPIGVYIQAAGSGTGVNGNVTIVANAGAGQDAIGTLMAPMSVTIFGGQKGTGSIFLSVGEASPATLNTVSGYINPRDFLNGTLDLGKITYNTMSTDGGLLSVAQGSYNFDGTLPTNSNIQIKSDNITVTNTLANAPSISLLASGNINIGADLTTAAGGLLLVAGGNISTTATGLKISTAVPTVASGAITMVAGAKYSESDGFVTITGASTSGGKIDFATNALSELSTTTSNFSTSSGSINLVAFSGTNQGSVRISNMATIDTSSYNSNAGSFTVVAGASTGTAIDIGNVNTTNQVGGNSGAIVLQAATPNVSPTNLYGVKYTGEITQGNPVATDAKNYTAGEIHALTLRSRSGSVTISSAGNLAIDTIDVGGSSFNGNAGTTKITNASTTSDLYIGDPSKANYIDTITASAVTLGFGGIVTIAQTGGKGLSISDASALNFDNAGDKKGGILTLSTTDVLNLNDYTTINANASGAGLAGTIDISAKDVIFNGQTVSLLADSPTFAGGDISIVLSGTTAHSIGKTADFYLSAAGGGGKITYGTDNAALILDGSGINVAALANGSISGGYIDISALGISNPSKVIALNADGGDTTNGGQIIIFDLSATNLTIGTAPGNFQFSAQGGKTSGNGGQVSVNTGGSMVVDPAQLLLGPQSGTGNGGSLSLVAGGTLLVNGSLNMDAGTGGIAGSINLTSKSAIPFTIGGSKLTNGVTGTLSTLGLESKVSTLFGQTYITNLGGGITNSGAYSSYLRLIEFANGPIIVNGALGGPNVNSITLSAAQGASLAITKYTIQAKSVGLLTDTGAITVSKLIADSVSFATTQTKTGTVSITSLNPIGNNLDIGFGIGTKITVITPGSLSMTTTLQGGAITLTSTAKTGTTIDLNGTVTATGLLTLTAPGQISIDGKTSALGGIKATTKDIGANIITSAAMTTSAASAITLTSGAGSIVQTLGSDMNASKTITLSAPKGSVTLGNVGGTAEPLALSATGLTGVVALGDIKVANSVLLKGSGSGSGSSIVDLRNNITVSSTKGTLTITSGAASQVVDTSHPFYLTLKAATVTITGPTGIFLSSSNPIATTKALTLTAAKGTVEFDAAEATLANVVVNAFDKVTMGVINAGTTVAVKTTDTKAVGAAEIVIHGSITTPTTGTVTLTAATGSGINDIGSTTRTITSGAITLVGPSGVNLAGGGTRLDAKSKGVAITSAKGNIDVNFNGKIDAATTAVLTAFGNINSSTQITAGTGITMTASDKATGNIALSNTVQTTGTGSKITLTANGPLGISETGGTLTSQGPLTIKATLGPLTNTGGITSKAGAISITSVDYDGSAGQVKAGLGLTIAATGKTLANFLKAGISYADNGAISIKGAGGSVSLATNKFIDATGLGKVKAPILINATNTAVGTTITIDGTVANHGVGGNVTIAIGAAPSSGKNAILTGDITGITVSNSTTGKVFAGVNKAAIIGPAVGMAQLSTVNAANVILNSANSANTITFLNNSSVTADPPAAAITVPRLTAINVPTSNSVELIATPAAVAGATGTSNFANSTFIAPQTQPLADGIAISQRIGRPTLNLDWISDTELSGGKIPARLHQVSGTSILDGGSLLVAADADSVISTPHGDVTIKAKSLVLVMTFTHGMAVYNLHDNCKNAVQITAGGRTTSVAPGKSTVVAREHIRRFEDINPAQLVCYGEINETILGNGLKMFHGEYSMPSAINAVPTLRNLLGAKDAKSKKIADDFLKTTSIVLQLRNNANNFKQILKPQLTAYNR